MPWGTISLFFCLLGKAGFAFGSAFVGGKQKIRTRISVRKTEEISLEKTVSKKTRITDLVLALGIISVITFCTRFFSGIPLLWVRSALQWAANILMGLVALFFVKKSGRKEDYGFKNAKAYAIGLAIAVLLQLVIGVIPALLGQSLVGTHRDFVLWELVYQFFYFVLVIGPAEEWIFRVYVQGTIVDLLPRAKWLGVVAASVLFGLWHLINGNLIQVFFTFLIGCVFGFAKYRIQNCRYSGVAFAHGLYDFLNVVTTILFV